MGAEPFFDRSFPEWALVSAEFGAGVSVATRVVAAIELLTVGLMLALVVALARAAIREVGLTFRRASIPVLEGADDELHTAHAQYTFVWAALRRKVFTADLREVLRRADQRFEAQRAVLARAAPRLGPTEARRASRMFASVSAVREAAARLATRWCERLPGGARPFTEALDVLRRADPRLLRSRGVGLRALVVASGLLLVLEPTAVVPPFNNPVVVVVFGVPVLCAGGLFVTSALLQGPARAVLTAISLVGLGALAALAALVGWWVTLLPSIAVALGWAVSRRLVRA